MRKVKRLLDMPVFEIGDGKEIGQVKEILFDDAMKAVQGIVLDNPGWFQDGSGVCFSGITAFGQDAITLNDSSVVSADLCNDPKLIGTKQLLGKKIMTETGQQLGILTDVLFNDQTGEIQGYEISDSLLGDILDGRRIMPTPRAQMVSDETIIVPECMVNLVQKLQSEVS